MGKTFRGNEVDIKHRRKEERRHRKLFNRRMSSDNHAGIVERAEDQRTRRALRNVRNAKAMGLL